MGRARLREVLGAEFPALLVAPPESHAGPRRCFHVAHVFRTLKRDSKLRLWSVLQRCGRTAVPHARRCLATAVCQRIGLHDNVANAATTTARCLLQLVTQYTGILLFDFRLQFCFVFFFSFQLSSSRHSRAR
uniref:Uncharacterized protein n=1 Tax=Ixodes ricinus TaxID=34613 RepID=A0A6B0URC1_IXORI